MSGDVTIHLGPWIVLDKSQLDNRLLRHLYEALTIPNPVWHDAIRAGVSTNGLEPYVALYEDVGPNLYIPRGFLTRLCDGLDRSGLTWTLRDNRKAVRWPDSLDYGRSADLRTYQEDAVTKMLWAQQGVYMAPPGSGKTVTALEAIHRAGVTTLIIVNTANIAEQWRERARQHVGMELGIFGDGREEIAPVTVALVQTLWARREKLNENGFWNWWGMVLVDECHHVTADTYTHLIQKFPAKYRFGVSATPERREGYGPLVEAVLGPTVAHTGRRTLVEGGNILTPSVTVVRTSFSPSKPWERYNDLMAELVESADRNALIAGIVAAELRRGHACLVLSRRVAHLRYLRERVVGAGLPSEAAVLLTGDQQTEERLAITARAAQGHIAIFSTIADEALDIPRLDRLFLTYPTRTTSVVRQQLGRIERPHPDKRDAIVYDFWDARVTALNAQYARRRQDVYDSEGLAVGVIV